MNLFPISSYYVKMFNLKSIQCKHTYIESMYSDDSPSKLITLVFHQMNSVNNSMPVFI